MNEFEIPHIAIAGNPNSGKSTIFNALTGLRQKVSNYPGVTVEKHEGVLQVEGIEEVHAIDLPGIYSLNPRSMDEVVAHDVLLGMRKDTPEPQIIIAVVDAGTLERNLFLTTQLLSLGKPVIVALNMMDVCQHLGVNIDVAQLERRLGVPVVPMTASRGKGIPELKSAIRNMLSSPTPTRDVIEIPPAIIEPITRLADELVSAGFVHAEAARGEALRLICTQDSLSRPRYNPVRERLRPLVEDSRTRIEQSELSWYAVEAKARYAFIDQLMPGVRGERRHQPLLTERLDAFLTHPVGGPLSLAFIVLLIFISIFKLAQIPMDWIETIFGLLAEWVITHVPAGPIQDLLTEGVIAGVGGVLVFLPQIMLLFFFIAIMEDSGYTARAAFILDHWMGRVGMHGKAFIPLFSSFACAIPGVMAARVIDNEKDRLLTIMIAPLMCCAARWPVYLLIAGTVIPNVAVLGFLPLPALVLGGMVILGVVAAIAVAAVFNRTILKGKTTTLPLDLPRYRRPQIRTLLHVMWERSVLFIKKAGTVILAMSIIMWALTNYPRKPETPAEERIQHSIAGNFGKIIEPVIAPIGFDWRIGVATLSSLVAREVFVSSMATIYGVEVADPHKTADLQARLREERDPKTGKPFFTPLRGICIMLFYVLSMQCLSTLVVVRRETGSWKWTGFQWLYMTALAWGVCFIVWQGGRWLGWG